MSDLLMQFNFLLNIRHAVLAYCFVIKVLKDHHSLGLVGPGFAPGEVRLCAGFGVVSAPCPPPQSGFSSGIWLATSTVLLPDGVGCAVGRGFGHRGWGLLALGCVRPPPTASVQREEAFNGI